MISQKYISMYSNPLHSIPIYRSFNGNYSIYFLVSQVMTWQTFNLVLHNQQRRGQWIGNNKVFESQQQGGGVQIFNNNVLAQLHPSLHKDSSIRKKPQEQILHCNLLRLFWSGYLSTVWFGCIHLWLGPATETMIWHLRSKGGTKTQKVLHICETCKGNQARIWV